MITEAVTFENWIKENFEMVLSGESEYRAIAGNAYVAEITKDTTKIYFQYTEDMGEEDRYDEIDTKELYDLMVEYCNKVREFNRENYGC